MYENYRDPPQQADALIHLSVVGQMKTDLGLMSPLFLGILAVSKLLAAVCSSLDSDLEI